MDSLNTHLYKNRRKKHLHRHKQNWAMKRQPTSTDFILGGGSKGLSSLSVSTSPRLRRLYIESPVTWKLRVISISTQSLKPVSTEIRNKTVITFPKIVFFRSSHSHLSNDIKNWLPFECGEPAFAHATKPLWLNLRREWNSSGNAPP